MSIRRRKGLVAAMEELDVTQISEVPVNSTEEVIDPEVGEPQADQPETEPIAFSDAAESPEAQEVEVVEAENEAVSVEEQIDDALDVIDQIEQVSDIVDRGAENGGLDQTGAELLTATLEGLYDRIGFDYSNKKIVPSIEEFGSVSQRIRSTNVSVEAIQVNLKAILDQVIKAILVLFEQVKQFFIQMFNQAEKYKAKSAKLREIMGKVPENVGTGELESAKVANALAKGNQVANVAQGLGEYSQVVENVSKSVDQMSSFVGPELDKVLQGARQADNRAGIEQMASEIGKISNKVLGTINLGTKTGGGTVSPVLMGNIRFSSTMKEGGSYPVFVAENPDAQEVSPKLKMLNKGEVTQILDATDILLDQVLKLKKASQEIGKAVGGITKGLKSLNNAMKTKEGNISSLTGSVKGVTSFLMDAPKVVTRRSLIAVGASLAYSEMALKAMAPQKEATAQPEAQPA